MAIVERNYKTVTKQVPSGVTLELTETEAIVLLNVLFHIGGCPSTALANLQIISRSL